MCFSLRKPPSRPDLSVESERESSQAIRRTVALPRNPRVSASVPSKSLLILIPSYSNKFFSPVKDLSYRACARVHGSDLACRVFLFFRMRATPVCILLNVCHFVLAPGELRSRWQARCHLKQPHRSIISIERPSTARSGSSRPTITNSEAWRCGARLSFHRRVTN